MRNYKITEYICENSVYYLNIKYKEIKKKNDNINVLKLTNYYYKKIALKNARRTKNET